MRNGQTISKTTQAVVTAGQEIAVSVKLDGQNQKELVATVATARQPLRNCSPGRAASSCPSGSASSRGLKGKADGPVFPVVFFRFS